MGHSKKLLQSYINFDDYLEAGLENLISAVGTNTIDFDAINSSKEHLNLLKNQTEMSQWAPITKSLYHKMISNWIKIFPDINNKFIFLDGNEILKNPGPIFETLQRKLGLRIELHASDFVRSLENKKLFCLKRREFRNDKGLTDRNPICLAKHKGRTQNGESFLESTRRRLADFYRIPNEKFFDLIGQIIYCTFVGKAVFGF